MAAPVLRPYQVQALEHLRAQLRAGRRRPLLVSPTGCHAPGQLLLTADGIARRVEDFQVGDQLMGPDSRPRTVLQLRRGRGPLVRIVPVKGEPFVVNEDHVLTLVRTNDGTAASGELVDVSVRDWMTWSKTAKHVHKLVRTGVEFAPSPAPLPIDPYFLGVLLGDGSLRHCVGVCKPDPEIRACVEEQAAKYGLAIRLDGEGTSATQYLSSVLGSRSNPVIDLLRALGLHGCDSATKHIPSCFKTASRAERLALLAGLLDMDGSLSTAGFDFISKSQQLSADVAFVARSLGLAAYITACEKSCQTGARGVYHRVSISGWTDQVPCRIPRKQAPARRQVKSVLRTGFSVEPAGEGEYFGFTLDGDGRYLMGDFTVTHNSGKTVTAAELVRSAVAKGSRVLVVAHLKEIIDQTSAKLDAYAVPHGVIQASHWRRFPDLPVQIASVQTLVRREFPPAELLVIDEAHHARAGTYGKIIEAYPKAPLIGLTATPWRGDGKGLGELFDAMVVAATPAQLIEQGHLVRFGGFSFELPDLSGVRQKGSDYDEIQLEMACNKARIVGGIVDEWLAHAGGVRTICFAVGVAHSLSIVERFRQAGVAAEHLDADTPKPEREAILARLAAGTTRVLSNVGILTEGWDCPSAACCILARPTKSLVLYLQMVGRVLRPHPESGKDRALLFDHAGAMLEHGLPDEPRDYSLEADVARGKRDQAHGVVQCPPPCGRVYPATDPCCPECGALNARQRRPGDAEREVEEVQAQRKLAIDEIRSIRNVSVRTQAAEYKRLLKLAEAKGYKTGWAAHKFKATFGDWPRRIPPEVMADVVPATRPVVDLRLLRALQALASQEAA